MIAALANGVSRLTNYSTSADCVATLSCLSELGVRIDRSGAEILIHGVGKEGLRAPRKELDCGNSGTTMRLLAGILAGQSFYFHADRRRISALTSDATSRRAVWK